LQRIEQKDFTIYHITTKNTIEGNTNFDIDDDDLFLKGLYNLSQNEKEFIINDLDEYLKSSKTIITYNKNNIKILNEKVNDKNEKDNWGILRHSDIISKIEKSGTIFLII
jgi:hypothetical protein